MMLAALLLAAIVTERNDVYHSIGYGELGCYTPPQYTFVGSASHPGIESCWIPYGTYTGGSGGTEYLRVTDHLMGVVASALAGLSERAQHSPFMLRPMGVSDRRYTYTWLQDDGSFLESTTNLTLRIADQLNLPMMYVEKNGTNYTYTVTSGESNCLEPRILQCAELFGSRKLESLITAQGHSIEPPISSEWSTDLPYKVSDTNLWRYVYPVLGYCTNDIHFLPAGGIGQGSWNAFPYAWGMGSLESIWGNDVVQGYWDVVWGIDGNPLPFTIEDVLSYDTGWKYEVPPRLTNDYWTVDGQQLNRDYIEGSWDNLPNSYAALWIFYASNFIYRIYWNSPDEWQYEVRTYPEGELVSLTLTRDQPTSTLLYFEDGTVATKTELYADTDDYTHWTNGTTRLDWKRLGIICQLERQMEIDYESNDVTDELPLYTMRANHKLSFESDDPIMVPIPGSARYNGEQWVYSNLFQGVIWEQKDEEYSSTTNQDYWSTPTCRVPPASFEGGYFLDFNGVSEEVRYEGQDLADLIAQLALQFTNNLSYVEIYGTTMGSPLEVSPMYLNLHYFVGGIIEVETPSNTVEVTTSDGFHESMWSMLSLVDGSPWNFSHDGNEAEIYLGTSSATGLDVYYHTEDYNKSINCNAYYAFDNDSGSYTTPTITFIATGSGSVTNWLWDIPEFGSPECHMYEGNGYVYWSFSGYNAYVYYYVADGTYDFGVYDDTGEAFLYYYYHDNTGGGLPRTFTFTNVTVDWNTSSYTEEETVGSGGPYDHNFPVIWDTGYDEHEVYVNASLGKGAMATFTYAEGDRYTNIVNSFNWPQSYDWNRIYSQRRSELDLLLYASGSASRCDITTPDDEFTWEILKRYVDPEAVNYVEDYDGEVGRLFRMMQGYNSLTYESAKRARYNQLVALNAACMSKCRDIGGMPIGSIENFAKITADEKGPFLDAIRNRELVVTFGIGGRDIYIAAELHFDESDHEYIIDRMVYPENVYEYSFGSYGVSASAGQGSSTNSVLKTYKGVRADGWQAPVNKTLYKYKNLRDPNL